jgi:hypothetical protein
MKFNKEGKNKKNEMLGLLTKHILYRLQVRTQNMRSETVGQKLTSIIATKPGKSESQLCI